MSFEDRDNHWFGGRGRFRGRFRSHGDGPPWARWMFGGSPPRAERGNVRYLVLDAIAKEPRHGYEIMQAIEEKSGGAYRPSPGVIYPTLQMLEELGHVRATERDAKKIYAITPAGTRDLEEHKDDVAAFYEQSEDVWDDHADAAQDVAERVRRLARAFRRAARRGRLTRQNVAKIRAILDDAIAKLEELVDQ